MDVDSLLAALGLKKGAVIAGLLGALISYRFFKELEWKERTITVFSGLVIAVYCGPMVAEMVKASEKMEMGITLLVGALGVSVLSAIVKALPEFITGLREWLFK